jgi:PQQ-dependent dehydrogenase (methanol/ethanol family)
MLDAVKSCPQKADTGLKGLAPELEHDFSRFGGGLRNSRNGVLDGLQKSGPNACNWLAHHVRLVSHALLLLGALSTSCQTRPAPVVSQNTGAASGKIVGQLVVPAVLDAEEDGQWPMAARNYASTRFSKLDEINSGNVAGLKLSWTFPTGLKSGHEAAPLIVDGTMYLTTPFPNALYAIDLHRPSGAKWRYEPKPDPAARGVACCDAVNRGGAYYEGRIYYNSLDGHTIAVDAASGKEAWKQKVADVNKGETLTMAPVVVKGKVLVGNSGGEFGARGWLAALDASSGAVRWRAYSTGPDVDVLIGPDFHPHYAMDRGKDLGVSSWPPDAWKIGGGNAWGWISYDPELDLIYYGTGNPGPWNPEQRSGDNKWTAGIFARSPDDGTARWFYQWSPHDAFDYDGTNEQILLDLVGEGVTRKVLIRAERNGNFYVLDRTTGEVLSATPFVHVTTSRGVDLQTGRLRIVHEKTPQPGRVIRDICPAAPGGKDWQPMAFSPRTHLAYIPHNNLCQDEEGIEVSYIAGTPYLGANVRMYPGPGGHRGWFTAWDPVAAKPSWQIKERFPVWSGALATAGDIVFYGTMEGWFKAVDARTGRLLWQFHTASGIIGQPVTFRAPDGKQYIAIFSGVGGWAGASVTAKLDPRDPTAALGFNGAMTDLAQHTGTGGMLYVFALP